MRARLRRLASAPLLHFLALGALAFAWLGPDAGGVEDPPREIALDASGLTPDELEARIEEEILVREALALGLDRGERIVATRLAELGGFLEMDAPGDAGALALRARDLGLDRSDPVIRRHLATQMRGLLSALPPGDWPDESELATYLAEHADEFATPARVRLTQVFLSRDRRGAATERDAAALLAELARKGTPPEAASGRGDPWGRGSPALLAAPSDLDASFGPGFGARVDGLPLHRWSGPLSSSYGLHLVWVHQRLPPAVPALAAVRSRVLQRILAARRTQRLEERMAALRKRYRVRATAL